MDETLGDRDGDDDESDRAEALGPRRAAEEQPPDNDNQPKADAAKNRGPAVFRCEDGKDEHDEPLQSHGDQSWPYAEQFSMSRMVVIHKVGSTTMGNVTQGFKRSTIQIAKLR